MIVRVLLITPQFYGIEKKIKSILEELDYEVIWIENKTLQFDYHGINSKFKLFRKIYFFLLAPRICYLKKELNRIGNLKFDILFSINAQIICKYLFKKLKRTNPEIHSVLYLWDSFSMYNWIKELKLFDKVYTFDPVDSINYKIEYKPNFYLRSNINISPENEYDLFFVGKFSQDRLVKIDKILTLPEMRGIKCFVKLWPSYKIFLHNHFIFRFFKAFNFKSKWVRNYQLNFEVLEGKIKREYLVEESLSYEEMQHHLICSNVILDLPFQRQTGYTHRLIGALANGKKVITTNSYIVKEKFFNSGQIHILDHQNPEVDCNWITKKSTFQVDSFFLELELSTWLKSVINAGMA